jgi:hypothetical protein
MRRGGNALSALAATQINREVSGYLEAGESQAALVAIRHHTHTGKPLGSAEFLRAVEGQTKRRLALQKRGAVERALAK